MGLKVQLLSLGLDGIEDVIDEAYNGQQAINLVKSGFYQNGYSFGLIFMDCSMPILDGYEASDWIRNFVRKENLLQPMIIACTGHTEQEYLLKAWRHQMDEILPKPVKFEVLKEILLEIIVKN